MLSETRLRKTIFLLVFITLLAYMLLQEISIILVNESMEEYQDNYLFILKIISFCISITILLITTKSSFIIKILPWVNDISGKYEGTSDQINKKTLEILDNHEEYFTITQSIITTKISGNSYDKENKNYAKFTGYLYESDDDNNMYKFIIFFKTLKAEFTSVFNLEIKDGKLTGYAPSKENMWSFNMKKTS